MPASLSSLMPCPQAALDCSGPFNLMCWMAVLHWLGQCQNGLGQCPNPFKQAWFGSALGKILCTPLASMQTHTQASKRHYKCSRGEKPIQWGEWPRENSRGQIERHGEQHLIPRAQDSPPLLHVKVSLACVSIPCIAMTTQGDTSGFLWSL